LFSFVSFCGGKVHFFLQKHPPPYFISRLRPVHVRPVAVKRLQPEQDLSEFFDHCVQWSRSVVCQSVSLSVCLSRGSTVQQKAQLSLTNRPTLVRAMLCCQELPSGEWLRFIKGIFRLLPTYSSPVWRPKWGGSLRAIGFIFSVGKLEWLGYNLMKIVWRSTQSFG